MIVRDLVGLIICLLFCPFLILAALLDLGIGTIDDIRKLFKSGKDKDND